MSDAMTISPQETDFTIGKGALTAYSRLSYTMWHALAEFIDNSTQSRLNYGSIIDDVLAQENKSLVVLSSLSRTTESGRRSRLKTTQSA